MYNPHKKYELELVHYLYKVYDNEIGQYKEILCMGDINIDLSLPGTHFQNDIIDVYGLSNLIVNPTCHKSIRGTLLDPILVTNKRFYLDSLNINCAYSDFHNITGCITRMHLQKQEPRKITYRSYNKFDDFEFKKDISYIPAAALIFDDPSDNYWHISPW